MVNLKHAVIYQSLKYAEHVRLIPRNPLILPEGVYILYTQFQKSARRCNPAAKAASSQVTDAVPNGFFFFSSKSENDTTAGVISHLAERPGFEPGAR